MVLNEADPIWGAMPATVKASSDGGRDVVCARSGGRYRITGSAITVVKTLTTSERTRLTTWIVDANRFAEEPPVVSTDVIREVRSRPSSSVGQQMDRLLAYFAHKGIRPGSKLSWLGTHQQTADTIRSQQETLAWLGAERDSEIVAFRQLLEDAGYLRGDGSSFHVTATGYVRMDEMSRGRLPTNQAFVAMWFGAEMESIYEEAIAPAIGETGFVAMRIDRKEHLNKIDDEIVAEIRRSRFLIADFTCGVVDSDGGKVAVPRGGVYYEAGLAQGLGMPVIWCVRQEQIGDVHFDTRQFNHIAWTDAADLRTRLINRIRANIADAR